jgi:hypothetical protein
MRSVADHTGSEWNPQRLEPVAERIANLKVVRATLSGSTDKAMRDLVALVDAEIDALQDEVAGR